jgi:predicted dehydrogenase
MAEAKLMRCAVIGCGFFAQNHLNAWRQMAPEGIELVAVCDIDKSKADAAASAFAVPRSYDRAEALLAAEKLDFVDIVTRMESHLDLVRLAAHRKIDVIVQKPLAPAWAEAVEVVRTAGQAGVRFAVHENFRFQTPMRKLRQALDSGVIGRPTWARIAFRTGYDIYRLQPYFHEAKRFIILDVGVHILDLARFFLGEVERISCEVQTRNPSNIGEDSATMLLRHVSGAVSVVECAFEARLEPDPFPETLVTVEGERGSIVLDPGLRARVTENGRTQELDFGSPLLSWTEHPWHTVQESVLLAQRAIIAAWRANSETETNGTDNLKTFALMEAAYAAAEKGCAISPRSIAEATR